MKITFNETQYEFKNFYSPSNGHEIHLFKDDELESIHPIWDLPSPDVMFGIYIQLLKKHIKFDSIKVNKK